MKAKTKRITLPVSESIDEIRDDLAKDTGIRMTYTQLLNYSSTWCESINHCLTYTQVRNQSHDG